MVLDFVYLNKCKYKSSFRQRLTADLLIVYKKLVCLFFKIRLNKSVIDSRVNAKRLTKTLKNHQISEKFLLNLDKI